MSNYSTEITLLGTRYRSTSHRRYVTFTIPTDGRPRLRRRTDSEQTALINHRFYVRHTEGTSDRVMTINFGDRQYLREREWYYIDSTCATCGKPIVTTASAGVRPLGRQSEWQHADGTGGGSGEYAAQWCETGEGYVKVEPAGGA